jgi:hypothetical protein
MTQGEELPMRVWMLVLLVVLIFAGAAYLFPMFARDRGSRKAPCISNAKQLELACIMYAQDYGEAPAKPRARGAGPSSPRRSTGFSKQVGAAGRRSAR